MSDMTNENTHIAWLAVAALSLVLSACGSRHESEPTPAVEDTAFGDMTGAMDKARGVEDTLQQQKENMDRSLQEAEGSTAQ